MILEDYGKGVLGPEVIAAALDGARKSGAPVVVDPNGRNYRRYAGSTVLTPNLREAELAAERPITDTDSLERRRGACRSDGCGPGHHPRGRGHQPVPPPRRLPTSNISTCRPSRWPSTT